jgi:hypothetical protein
MVDWINRLGGHVLEAGTEPMATQAAELSGPVPGETNQHAYKRLLCDVFKPYGLLITAQYIAGENDHFGDTGPYWPASWEIKVRKPSLIGARQIAGYELESVYRRVFNSLGLDHEQLKYILGHGDAVQIPEQIVEQLRKKLEVQGSPSEQAGNNSKYIQAILQETGIMKAAAAGR